MLKKITTVLFIVAVLIACEAKKNTNSYSFKSGYFKSYLENKRDSSSFYRVHDLQIETYKNKTDTFKITWKNKFEFSLLKVNPKSKLDSTNFVVKIKKIKKNTYDFEAGYENSNFKQKGSTYRVNNKQ
ncbi:hypothetical protein [Flavicella sp.]|uniref:hypothetical protein n=1 Tax=Flavicella sp. TaxID=2957742 RepID=UPI0030159012